jgi:hypothetical protein
MLLGQAVQQSRQQRQVPTTEGVTDDWHYEKQVAAVSAISP